MFPMQVGLQSEVVVRVRFSETDPVGVVWHGNYVKYLEDAREEFGRKWGLSYRYISECGYFAPVFDMHVRFDKSARVDQWLKVICRYRPSKGAKLCFDYTVTDAEDGTLIATAETVQLFTTKEGVFEPSVPAFFRQWKQKMECQEEDG